MEGITYYTMITYNNFNLAKYDRIGSTMKWFNFCRYNLAKPEGVAIAQWIICPRFESQAHHPHFYSQICVLCLSLY